MRKIYQPLFLLMMSINAFAQFKTVYSERTSLYKYENQSQGYVSEYVPVKVETYRIVGEDTLYDHYRVFKNYIENSGGDCQATGKEWSWLGKGIIMTQDGREIFINRDGDSVIFHKEVQLNEVWAFFIKEDVYFEAKAVKKEPETFTIHTTEVEDSVLTITIQLKNKADNSPVVHAFNGKEWKISKTYGFVKAYSLQNFPEDINPLILAGVNQFNIGAKNLTLKDIYDFNVGDELHVREYENSDKPKETKSIHKVIDKTLTAGSDSVVYRVAVLKNSTFEESGVEEFIVQSDTSLLKVALVSEGTGISRLPLIAESGEGYVDYTIQYLHGGTSRMAKRYFNQTLIPSEPVDSCFKIVVDLTTGLDYYIDGLGGPYYINWFSIFSSGRELVYYKKENVEWGTPYNLVTGVAGKRSVARIALSPNPATEHIRLANENLQNSVYKIYSTEGIEVINGQFLTNEETIDINSLRTGIYSMMILKDGEVLYTSRFVKH
jgi:hypothetical protein